MNIETIYDYIKTFNNEIIDLGFKRDVQDYLNSLPNNQNNIVTLRDIASKVSSKLNSIYEGDLPNMLNSLFPKSTVRPFTETNFDEKIANLITDSEIELNQFYSQLNQILNQLNQKLQENINEIDNIEEFIDPYIKISNSDLSQEKEAILSIIFIDQKTITNLNEFVKNISAWNRTIPIYHQIINSSSPKDIKIVEVQNGSVDFVINLNVDVAINLIELFTVGFKCYAAYLSYKKIIAPITEAYFGNQKLLKSEKAREEELLNNISIAISSKAEEQHKIAIKKDKNIDKNIDKKVEQITNLITSHIIKGNDIKLLALPKSDEDNEEEKEKKEERKIELANISRDVRSSIKKLPPSELQKLLREYGELKEE
ncbi:MAG: hypothetical protein IPH62_19270 [Ignavibacteriae bacterium]|nr:hypothetical protein [Ignavibacteriota bacterium]